MTTELAASKCFISEAISSMETVQPTVIEVPANWSDSCVHTESTLHQLSPYVGKLKSTIAQDLILQYTSPGDLVVDPFVGSGTVLLEATLNGRKAFGADISPYAELLTVSKITPPKNLDIALKLAEEALSLSKSLPAPDLRRVPAWVRKFFHPKTLKECINFAEICRLDPRFNTIFSCFLGILHHQRPGFLSYPSSHLVPYLRDKKFPKDLYPEMYKYRSIDQRLFAKISRAYKRTKIPESLLCKGVECQSIVNLVLPQKIDCVITSPPYMNALAYGRDNRLRLWFLDPSISTEIDRNQSQNKGGFSEVMKTFSAKISSSLKEGGYCIFIIGDKIRRSSKTSLTEIISNSVSEKGTRLVLESTMIDEIPDIRRSRRSNRGVRDEHFLIYRKV
jgi:DNA methylase